jgi:hypothetical protein
MRTFALALAALAAIATTGSSAAAAPAGAIGHCRSGASAADVRRLERLLGSRRDVLGDRLLATREGPTLAAAQRLLPPLLYAVGHGGAPLTRSGVYYLPFTLPLSVGGPRGFGLHVADGSEILVRRVDGPHLDVAVGVGGRERYGSCLTRLREPRLAEGYLPILQVAYRDALGTRYEQESFVGRLPGSGSLASFVRVTADAAGATRAATIRLASSHGVTLRRAVRPDGRVEIQAALVHHGARLIAIDASSYDSARAVVVGFWRRLLPAPHFDVPEAAVVEAERALEVQELAMTWRYSVGNVYEELSYAEALDVAQVMAGYGYREVARQILRFTLRRLPARFTYWRAGERMVAGAQYFRLTGDDAYVSEELPGLRAVVSRLEGELGSSHTGLLPRERYSSDIPDLIYSLQGQTLVWQGLLAMSRVWSATGRAELAERTRILGIRLEAGLRRAVRQSQRRLPDGSLFVPANLLEGSSPFDRLTDSRDGTYWNLVAPYAFASGFFRPHGAEAAGVLRYLMNHGSRLLGLVRAGAYRLASAESSASGTDQVYGVNVTRFLADNDQSDQLVLSLYGTLAAALTRGTYVAGEAATITPFRGNRCRAMYLPPNNGGAAAFLETLRLMLVHEARGREGKPTGLELAFATPRAWLRASRSIAVHDVPTSFGPLSYSVTRKGNLLQVDVVPPPAPARFGLALRLRLPVGETIASVQRGGRSVAFDRRTGTIDLSGMRGAVHVTAAVVSRGSPLGA